MNKTELIAHIVSTFATHPIVFTTGYAARIGFCLRPIATNHFYMVGSMGMASAIGRGLASALGAGSRYPVVIDGDGAVLMGIHGLLLEDESGGGILHIIANDAAYTSTGAQAVPSSVGRICNIARAAGYDYVKEIGQLAELKESLASADPLVRQGGSAFLNCHITAGPDPFGRIDVPLVDVASRFRGFTSDLRQSRITDKILIQR